MTKKPYLVVYDYGTGGVWAEMWASDERQILTKYPKLQVAKQRPSWMNEEEYRKIQITNTFDVDGEASGWLLSVKAEK